MPEIHLGEMLQYFWLGIANRGPFFVSLVVAVVAWQQWKTNQAAVQIAGDKRHDDLFDRRLTAFHVWGKVVSKMGSVGDSARPMSEVNECLSGLTDNGGNAARFLFDESIHDDISEILVLTAGQMGTDIAEAQNASGSVEPVLVPEVATIAHSVFTKEWKEREVTKRMAEHLKVFSGSITISDDIGGTPPGSS